MNYRKSVVVLFAASLALLGLALVLAPISIAANVEPIAIRADSPAVAPHPSAPRTIATSPVYTRPFDHPLPFYRAPQALQPSRPAPTPQAATRAEPLSLVTAPQAKDGRPIEPLAPPMPGSDNYAVCFTTARVWGFVNPYESAQVRINGVQRGADTATAKGFFWSTLYEANGNRTELATGDVVTLTHGLTTASQKLRAITAQLEVVSNVVAGTIGGVTTPLSVTVYIGGEPSTRSISRTVSTDAAGHFVVDTTPVWDLNAGDRVVVAYHENGWEVHRHLSPAQSLMVLPTPWHRVEGFAAPGSIVTVTAYFSDAVTVKETLAVTAQPGTWQDGYYSVDFTGPLNADDLVTARFADGAVLTRTVIPLSLNLDVANDRLTGQAVPGTLIQGMSSALFPQGWQSVMVSTTATASGLYTVNFSGKLDLLPGTWAGIITSDAAGNDLQLWRPSPYIEVNQTWDDVSGSGSYAPFDADGKPVTLTVYSSASHSTSVYVGQLGPYDGFRFYNDNTAMPDIRPGDALTVTDGVWTGVLPVTTNNTQANTQLDRITGSIVPPTNQVEVSGSYMDDYLFPINGNFNLPATATPFFTVTTGGFDLRDNVTYGAFHRTSAGYVDWRSRETGGFGLYPWWNGVQANFVDANVPYTITLYDGGSTAKGQLTGLSQYPNGNSDWRSFWDVNQQMQIGDRVQVQAANGYSRSITIPDVTLNFDRTNGAIYGHALPNVRLDAQVFDVSGGFIPTDGSGLYRANIHQLQEIYDSRALNWGDGWSIQYVNPDGTWLYYQYEWPQIIAHYSQGGYNDVWGNIGLPGNTIAVTITRPDDSVVFTGTTTTGTCNWCDARGWEIGVPDNTMHPGDRVTVDFGSDYIDTMDVLTITGAANVATDILTVTAPIDTQVMANANGPNGNWDSNWNHSNIVVGASGYVTFDLGAEGFNIVPGSNFNIHSVQAHNHNTQYSFDLPRNTIDVNYAHDWAYVNTDPNAPVSFTWRSAAGNVATYVGQTDSRGELWTDGSLWNPPNPDIQPGDAVTVTGAGLLAVVNPIGTINGTLNVAADAISGTINAPFGSTPLRVRCEVWVNNGPPGIEVNDVLANGGSYLCNFNGTWDIVPGQDVAVRYVEPDGDTVINVFRAPAPDVRIEKWAEGSGTVQAGGAVIYTLRYRNEGNAVAANVRLTDTLPNNTTYVTDTSRLPHMIGSGQVVWPIGTLQPGAFVQFQIVLNNTANPGDALTNQADISTSSLGDPDYNNHADATANVGSGQPDLWVGQGSNPGDPAPGQNFNYYIDYGNNNETASGPVWLTDTLPLSTTLVNWTTSNQYNAWTLMSTANGRAVFYAPTVPGRFSNQLVLTLKVNNGVPYETQLFNTVVITTNGDANPNDNQTTHEWVWVSPPRYGVSVNKSWGHGSLVPGEHINYWLNPNNNGNMPVSNVVMADVLPAGVTLVAVTRDMGGGNEVPYPPTSVTGNVLRWNVGSMAVAENRNVRIELAIPPTLTAGTVLTNCASIAVSAIEKDPYDNVSCTVDTVRSAGPNLRVVKYASWNNPNRVRYDVQIANIGSQTIQDVHITDTLPVSMSLAWWGVDFWDQWSGNWSSNQLTLTLTRLEPYQTTWLHIDADVPDVPNGTFFTNTAQIDTPAGEVYPQDNTSINVMGTGPDLSIAKWKSGGAVMAGQLLTYTLHYKNDTPWWTNGNLLITDTLPVGTQFVSAQQRDCWDVLFCDRPPNDIADRTLTWDFGQWGSWWWNDLIVTVRVSTTLTPGTILTNTATLGTNQPVDDREPNYANNEAISAIRYTLYSVYLPLIKK